MSNSLLRTSVKEATDAEKLGSSTWWDHPVIPFIPEKESTEISRDEYIEVSIKADKSSNITGNLNTLKKNMRRYSHGPVEMLLQWKGDLHEIIVQKPIVTPSSKFSFAEMLLGGDPLATFRAIKAEETTHTSVGESAPGETDGTFATVANKFVRHYFPRTIGITRRQKKYMRTYLKKTRSVTVQQMAERLMKMNSYLVLFPDQPHNTKLDEDELVEVMLSMSPMKWRTDMVRMNFEPAEVTFLQVQTCLEKIEMIEATEALSLNNKQKNKGNKGKDKSNKDDSKDSPLCALCTLLGGSPKTHATSQCYKKKAFDKSKKHGKGGYGSGDKRKKGEGVSKYTKELNALVEKKVKTLIKTQFKKSGLTYHEDSTEGESE